LYGDQNGKDFAKAFDQLNFLDEVAKFTAKNWSDLIEKYLIERQVDSI
jgi:Zn-dependent M16 (insulinase) family peptidase